MTKYKKGYVLEIEDPAKRGAKIISLLEKHGRLLLMLEGDGIRVDVPRGPVVPVPVAAQPAKSLAARMLGATM